MTPIPAIRAMTARPSSNLIRNEISPKTRLIRYLQDIKKQSDYSENRITNTNVDKLDKWLENNSIIEIIPGKLIFGGLNLINKFTNNTTNDHSFDEQFMRSFDYSADVIVNSSSSGVSQHSRSIRDANLIHTNRSDLKNNSEVEAKQSVNNKERILSSRWVVWHFGY